MGLYLVALRYNARQANKIQYSTIQYNTITGITQNNIRYSRQPSVRKITRINQEHTLYTISTQKLVEPKVDESVLKTTRNTKHSVSHTIQYSIAHILSRPTPHAILIYLYITPLLNSLCFTAYI
jgi:hypothetical protein